MENGISFLILLLLESTLIARSSIYLPHCPIKNKLYVEALIIASKGESVIFFFINWFLFDRTIWSFFPSSGNHKKPFRKSIKYRFEMGNVHLSYFLLLIISILRDRSGRSFPHHKHFLNALNISFVFKFMHSSYNPSLTAFDLVSE